MFRFFYSDEWMFKASLLTMPEQNYNQECSWEGGRNKVAGVVLNDDCVYESMLNDWLIGVLFLMLWRNCIVCILKLNFWSGVNDLTVGTNE